MTTFIKENVDIYRLPTVDTTSKDNTEVTIGDLHGNAMKLIFMLLKHGVAKGIDTSDYENLVKIYKKVAEKQHLDDSKVQEITQKDLVEFDRILGKLTFNPNIGVRLIGDELTDRGSNDYFTLMILGKLNDQKVPVEILFSNHSMEFIEAYERVAIDKSASFASNRLILYGQGNSAQALQMLVGRRLVSKEDVLAIVNRAYKPTVKAISYKLSEDNSEITIYSHAGIGINTIEDLAKKFDVDYKDGSTKELAETIDRINKVFQTHLQSNTIHTLYKAEEVDNNSSNPVEVISWNRDYSKIDRCQTHKGYNLRYVHGHDPLGISNDYVRNLDNTLGKTKDRNQGEYTVEVAAPNTVPFHAAPESLTSTTEVKDTAIPSLERPTPPPSDTEIEPEQPPFIPEGETKDEVKVKPKDETRPIMYDVEKGDLEKEFEQLLKQIEFKRDEFQKLGKKPGYEEAYQAADTLHKEVMESYTTFSTKERKTAGDIDTFKRECKTAIDKSRGVLEKHRGWKQVLGHLALAVLGLGVFYAMGLAAYKVSGAKFSIFKTDSHQKVDELEKGLDKFTPQSASNQ